MTDTEKKDDQKPTLITQHYIALVVTDKLEKNDARKWYQTVRDFGPEGVLATLQQTDPEGNPANVRMVCKEYKTHRKYIIPLTRSLEDTEAEDIVMVWSEKFPDIDFNIETDNPHDGQDDIDFEEEDDDSFDAASERVAKLLHDDWVDELKEKGWRYGPKISYVEKMHPMLMQWEHLPKNMREPRQGLLDKILNAINNGDEE